MQQTSSRCLLFMTALAIGLTTHGAAQAQQGKGTVTGHITDPGQIGLQGGRVELQPGGQWSVTDAQGQFAIPDVPTGEYSVTVSYLGLAPYTAHITVTAGGTARVEATLKLESVSQAVEVHAERERGELAALNRERTADTIIQVLPAEVIRSLPNTNVADALGRLPGVSLERDEGEGKYVQIRGTEPRLNNVTINGVHISSPEPDVRTVKLDVIPADLVESIELSKTLSANQDGDAIGGSINLVTRMANSEPFYSFSGLYGYTPIVNGRSLTTFDGTTGGRFGKQKKLGAIFGGSYDYNGRGINNIEPAPGTNDFGDGQGPVPVFTGIHLREYQYRRNRYGFAGTVDYQLGNGSSAFVRGLFSEFKDFGDTWNLEYNVGDLLTPTTSRDNGNMVYRHLNRTPEQRIFSVSTGEKLNLGSYLLDYQFAVSRSGQQGQFPSTYFDGPQNVAFGIDTSNPTTPKFPVLNGVNIYDPALYTLNRTVLADDHVRELDLEGSASLARHYAVGSVFGSFEFGGKIRNGDKQNRVNEGVYTATGTPLLTLNQTLQDNSDPNFYFGQYKLAPLSDYNKILRFISTNPAAVQLNVDKTRSRSDPNNYNTVERIYAGYGMNTLTFGKARIQTGIRFETTQSHFTGYHVAFDSLGHYVATTPVPGSNLYTSVLPSVQFQYAITPSTNLRAGYGMGIARPNFSDLPPFIVENDRSHSISVGNPALKPTKANNYDLLIEHYLNPVGLIQAGMFYKDLSNPIFSVQSPVSTGPYAGYSQVQPTNGRSARLLGFEATYQQRLGFLPGLLNGIGVAANYSYSTSRAVVPARAVDPALIRQGPNNWNLNVTYDKGRLSTRLGLTHNDAYIYAYNYTDGTDGGLKGPNGDVYTYAHTQLDAQGSYRIKGGLKAVISLLNLNNEVFGFYQGSGQYPVQREFYGPTFMFGFRWSNSKER